jgi:hypothetical protein
MLDGVVQRLMDFVENAVCGLVRPVLWGCAAVRVRCCWHSVWSKNDKQEHTGYQQKDEHIQDVFLMPQNQFLHVHAA